MFENGKTIGMIDLNELKIGVTQFKIANDNSTRKTASNPCPYVYINCNLFILDEVVLRYTPPFNNYHTINITRPTGTWTVGLNPNNRWTGLAQGYMNYASYLAKKAKTDRISNRLTNRERCVHDLMNNFNPNNTKTLMIDLLNKFSGTNSNFDVAIRSTGRIYVNGQEARGITDFFLGVGGIQISINSPWASSATSIEVANVILHEYIHADLFDKLSNPPSSGNFIDTYNFLR